MNDFKERVQIEYGNEYNLSIVKYEGTKNPVNIICPDHGVFKITPDNFIYNAGCPMCRGVHKRGYPARRGKGVEPKIKPGRKSTVKYYNFYIHNVSGGFLKFGITSGSVEDRRFYIDLASDFKHKTVFTKTFYNRRLCAAVERVIKLSFKTGVAPAGSMSDGITETVDLKHLDQIIRIVESFPPDKI